MKDRLLGVLPGFLTAFLLSFCGIGCVITGFAMPIDLWLLAFWCAVAALIGCLCSALKVGIIPWCLVAAQCGWYWRMGQLEQTAESFLYEISVIYNKAYSWGIVRWSGRVAQQLEMTLPLSLCILAVVVALLAAGPMCRGKSPALPLLAAGVCLGCCFVVTDTVPNPFMLGGLILAVALLLLPAAVRKRSQKEGNRLTWLVLLPTLVAVLVLLGCVPQSLYDGQKHADNLTQLLFEDTPIESLLNVNAPELVQTGNGSRVDLTTVGIRLDSQVEVMQVRAPEYKGVMYLRGQALDSYDGLSWYASGEKSSLPWPQSNHLTKAGTVRITTRYAHRLLYQPYYANTSAFDTEIDGLRNTEKLTEYSFQCFRGPQGTDQSYFETLRLLGTGYGGVSVPGDHCVELTDATRSWAEKIIRKLDIDGMDVAGKAYAIQEYVKNSAVYDKMTGRMPSNKKDFAKWFLEDSDTGYCVHFATAATVLLRAAGVPARYVTGYATTVDSGGNASVRAMDAHAWTEFYMPGVGWVILEATPPALEQEETTQAVEATGPSQQEEATRPSQEATKPNYEQEKPEAPQREQVDLSTALTALWYLLGAGVKIAVIYGQYRLRLWLRRRFAGKGSVNEQALEIWAQLVYLRKLLKSSPGGLPYELAQKAKFSQYTLTAGELQRLQVSLDAALAEVKAKPWYVRWIYRYIFAAY